MPGSGESKSKMPSVFEIDFLPTIVPLRFHYEFSSGANKPILITGVDKNSGDSKECVVKLMGSERMRPESASFELLASFIAWELGIAVVEPVLIEIIPEFVETLRGNYTFRTAQNSIGINYGSIYIAGDITQPNNIRLSDLKLYQALEIFTFDILIANEDRTQTKPNFLSGQNDLIIYDHELAFSFLYLILGNQASQLKITEPWRITEDDILNWISKMFLYPIVKGKPFPETEIIQKLYKISEDFWQKAFNLIPAEWQSDQLIRIKDTLNLVVSHKEQFVENIKRAIQ